MTENMTELKNLIVSHIADLELQKDKVTDEQQRIDIIDAIQLLKKARKKIIVAQEKNPYEKFEEEIHDITIGLKKLREDWEKDFENIEKLLQDIGSVKQLIKQLIKILY